LLECLDEPARTHNMRKEARADAQSRYRAAAIADRTVRLYKQILGVDQRG
jgi:hypothetical protein